MFTGNGASKCICCGIGESFWQKKIENDSMLNWDYLSVREKRSPKSKKSH